MILTTALQRSGGAPVMKISKKDQDPNANHEAGTALDKLLSKKSEHFALGTYICQFRKGRGLVKAISKDGGTRLLIEWEDGSLESIENPNHKPNWLRRLGNNG